METVIRVIVIYLFLMIGLRVLGKREFGQLSPLELVSLLLIPELVSSALQSEDFSVVDAIVAVCTLLSLTILTSIAQHLSKKAEILIAGEPTVLVHPSCNSWYNGGNIPGKKRMYMGYTAGIPEYRRRCEEIAANGYTGFVLA